MSLVLSLGVSRVCMRATRVWAGLPAIGVLFRASLRVAHWSCVAMAHEPGGFGGILQNIFSPTRNTDAIVEPQTTVGIVDAPVNLGPEGVATPTNNIPPMQLPAGTAARAGLTDSQTAGQRSASDTSRPLVRVGGHVYEYRGLFSAPYTVCPCLLTEYVRVLSDLLLWNPTVSPRLVVLGNKISCLDGQVG